MENAVGRYLDVVSEEKRQIRSTSWNGMRMAYLTNTVRQLLYFGFAALAFGFGIIAAVMEDYPGNIKKPWQIIVTMQSLKVHSYP